MQQPSEYNYNHATSSSKNSSNGMPFANRPVPFLCHESAMNQQQAYNHMMNNQGACCPQQPLISNEHIYNEYEPYQHRKFNSRWVFWRLFELDLIGDSWWSGGELTTFDKGLVWEGIRKKSAYSFKVDEQELSH